MFQVLKQDGQSKARLGRLTLSHGVVDTPAFMPVGTAATVKAMPHDYLESLDSQIILANTYHLYLRPGDERIARLGGLHKFMSWTRCIVTDSGGYQIFSQRDLISVSQEGARFKSHLDGSRHFFTPEKSMMVQQRLGADIMTVLDECIPYPSTHFEAAKSLELTLHWAERCKRSYSTQMSGRQALFGIVQGSVYPDLRQHAVERLQEIDFAGYAIGGLSVGEPKELMYEVTAQCGELLPEGFPRYLMGVGTPPDLLECVALGVDMFDCVLPTRNARNGYLFTSRGRLSIKNACYAEDVRPIDERCLCQVCRRFSRSYLRHLYMAGEIVSSVYNTLHNLHFYLDLMAKIRESIASQNFLEFKRNFLGEYCSEDETVRSRDISSI
ncbi:MAG: tRNA guanosine(34) transglycosylase Tgt [Acidobacteria bacterium]|nr:tRNA guanosine(34) transglycosylase Tgt [Acidobacteriota bacterium]